MDSSETSRDIFRVAFLCLSCIQTKGLLFTSAFVAESHHLCAKKCFKIHCYSSLVFFERRTIENNRVQQALSLSRKKSKFFFHGPKKLAKKTPSMEKKNHRTFVGFSQQCNLRNILVSPSSYCVTLCISAADLHAPMLKPSVSVL